MSKIRKAILLLTPKEHRRGVLVLVMVMIMALLETAGVASVMPFLAVLGNPAVVETNAALRWAYEAFGFQSINDFLFVLGVTAFVVVVVGALFRALTHYAMFRFVQMRRHSISARLLQGYLGQPYEFFLNRNVADLSKSILSEVDQLVQNVFNPGVQMLAYTVVMVALVAFLLVVDPVLALVAAGIIGGAYAGIYITARGLLSRIGQDRLRSNQERFAAAGEALGGIKDVKVLGREQAYIHRFQGPSLRFSSHQATNETLSEVPKFLIEAVGFGTILVLALILLTTRDDLGQVLPILGLYAFAGYRLLPAAQKVYRGLAKFRFGVAAVESVYEDLRNRPVKGKRRADSDSVLPLTASISFDHVTFYYPESDRPALQEMTLEIPARTTVGFVGGTGAGKTTAVDLILGLLRPTQGNIVVDGLPLNAEQVRFWQNTIGYVPQNIYLADATVEENIALGLEYHEIDGQAVEQAARIANVHDFIVNELPHGYATDVGERGVRLSGGQCQRIGIARALYRNPSLLVFDEATSALDMATESVIMEAIEGLMHQKTIIMVAHRLSTVRNCDIIFVLSQGRLVTQGTYRELLEGSDTFRKLARAGSL